MSFRVDIIRGAYPITPRKGISERSMSKKSSQKMEGITVKREMKGKITYRDIMGKTHHAKPNSLVTQTILFNKEKFTKQEAINWLKKHGKIHELDVSEPGYWRARQVSPTKFRDDVKMATFQIADGVLDVGGKLKH